MFTGADRPTRSLFSFLTMSTAVTLEPLLSSAGSMAQSASARGTISGTVTDQQGNVVAGAQVTIRSADFTSARTLTTSDSGVFAAAMLYPGVYTVEVKAPGFGIKK